MSTVRLNEFQAAPGKAAALRAFLQSIIGIVEAAPGCLGCELLAGSEDDSRLVIIERWESAADHQAAAKLIPREKVAEVQPLLADPPKGRYYAPVT